MHPPRARAHRAASLPLRFDPGPLPPNDVKIVFVALDSAPDPVRLNLNSPPPSSADLWRRWSARCRRRPFPEGRIDRRPCRFRRARCRRHGVPGEAFMTRLDGDAYATHEVLHQAPPLADYDACGTDGTLPSVVAAFEAEWAESPLHQAGQTVGSAHVQELARQANRNLPELRTHDRFGNRVDRIDFHPAWHELMGLAIGQETHALCWNNPRPGAQVARAALSYLWNQGENGICCPIGMTYSAVPILRRDPARWTEWGHLITSTSYDRRQVSATDKTGATVGMAMTEKQGGSDLRRTQTRALPNGDGTWSLVGHKWFFSVPHSDVFLTLAQTDAGVSCFVVAGWLPDGSRNRVEIQRLKDKCGNKSNASSEVEFRGAVAHMIGEPGRGIRAGLEMNHYTRLDFAVGSAGLMRQALAQAAHHVAHRRAFQRALIDQPIMANVVADLAIEVEAATWLSFRFVAALDREVDNEAERLLGRVGAPIAKYWVCKRAGGRGRGFGVPRGQRLHRRSPHSASLQRGAAQRDLGGHRQ